jgi:hypothetical protein
MSPLRFWRRKRVFPGVTLNLSKSGASVSIGVRGAHYTVGPAGERITIGVPGTGLFLTQKLDSRPRRQVAAPSQPQPQLSRGGASVILIGLAIAFFGLLIWIGSLSHH